MIYLLENPDLITDDVIDEFLPKMPLDRLSKASRYRRKTDRNLCVLGYWLLCYGLRGEYGILEYPQFVYSEYGKPNLEDLPQIYFNISHCKAGVVCALSQNEVGIDIQDVRRYNHDVAKRVCTDEEMEQLAICQHPDKLFCRLWTIKESHLKMLGASAEGLERKIPAELVMKQSPGYVYTYWGNGYYMCCFGEKDIVTVNWLTICNTNM